MEIAEILIELHCVAISFQLIYMWTPSHHPWGSLYFENQTAGYYGVDLHYM